MCLLSSRSYKEQEELGPAQSELRIQFSIRSPRFFKNDICVNLWSSEFTNLFDSSDENFPVYALLKPNIYKLFENQNLLPPANNNNVQLETTAILEK